MEEAILLEGKVALVTGAGRGLGEAHAHALAAAGATVVVNDLGGSAQGDGADRQVAERVADQITAAGGRATADVGDVSSWLDMRRLVDDVVSRHGALDILVNNAGICLATAFGSLDESAWDRLMDVNAKGTAALIDAAARYWRHDGPATGRAIVNTASPQGAHPVAPIGIYSASKAAVLALTQVAAMELAPLGVRVNALAPIARTRMVGQAADAEAIMPRGPGFDRYLPANVAQMVVYLSSSLCRFTGRLFGLRGDEAFLYSEWDASHHTSNSGRTWTPEALAAKLDEFPLQDFRRTLAPLDLPDPLPSPPDSIIQALVQTSAR